MPLGLVYWGGDWTSKNIPSFTKLKKKKKFFGMLASVCIFENRPWERKEPSNLS